MSGRSRILARDRGPNGVKLPERIAPMAAQDPRPVYKSGDWEIDLARRELRLKGQPVDLGSRAFEVVEVLVESAASWSANMP